MKFKTTRPREVGAFLGLNQKFAGGKFKGLSLLDYKPNTLNGQRCHGCGGEDLKFAVKNFGQIYCQLCAQKVEFIKRERPEIAAQIRIENGMRQTKRRVSR